ncbi:MAG: hypothetical protein JSR91_23550 [Proteobacteria bacterium]|nr:hypothetical protein [Pseudomonadota bacterium]
MTLFVSGNDIKVDRDVVDILKATSSARTPRYRRRWSLGQEEVRSLAMGPEQPLDRPQKKCLCGDQLTIADRFCAPITTAGKLTHCDFSDYSDITRGLDTFKARPNCPKIYETFTGFCASTNSQPWPAL